MFSDAEDVEDVEDGGAAADFMTDDETDDETDEIGAEDDDEDTELISFENQYSTYASVPTLSSTHRNGTSRATCCCVNRSVPCNVA